MHELVRQRAETRGVHDERARVRRVVAVRRARIVVEELLRAREERLAILEQPDLEHAGGALVEVLLLEQCGLAAQKAGRDPLDRGGTAIADHHERWLDEHREALTLQPLLELGGTRLELLQRGPRLFLLLG